jgi:hypothetical protein
MKNVQNLVFPGLRIGSISNTNSLNNTFQLTNGKLSLFGTYNYNCEQNNN